MNKSALFPFAISVLLFCIALSEIIPNGWWNFKYQLIFSALMVNITGIAFIFQNSDFQKSWLFYLLLFSYLILVPGIAFKIMHWPNSVLFAYFSLCLSLLCCILRITGKKVIKTSHLLKLLWAISPASAFIAANHFRNEYINIYFISSILAILTVGTMLGRPSNLKKPTIEKKS